MKFVTRFAPSPTGLLHLGHAYSAMLAHDMATDAGGTFLLRIDDLDTARCRPEFETAIYDNLRWLGLTWNTPVWRQSERRAAYDGALNQLINAGLCYPCSCSRGDIRAAISAPQEGGDTNEHNQIYPETCRHRSMATRGETDAIRLNMGAALATLPDITGLNFTETGPKYSGIHHLSPDHLHKKTGDIVLARRDSGAASYHLSVVVDDAAQGITNIIRGRDLFQATFIHRLLQALLNLPTPTYHHHRLVRDNTGKRLAKRDDARAIQTYREQGLTPADIRDMLKT